MTARTSESALIERMLGRLGPPGRGVEIGPGDDAAVLSGAEGSLVIAADLLVEGGHFDLELSSSADVGFKGITVNVSDIAAMGAVPRFAVVSIGLPGEQTEATADALYEGIAEAAASFDLSVVGGDTVRSEKLLVAVTVTGETAGVPAVTRSGARAGDVICVTGDLGAAAAGLMLWRDRGVDGLPPGAEALLLAHRRGRARPQAGRLAAQTGAHAMIDVSDGFARDLSRICAASNVGAVIDVEALPVASGVPEAAALLGVEPADLALGGGDDYELIIVADEAAAVSLAQRMKDPGLTIVGRVVEGEGLRTLGGAELGQAGWDPFT